MKTFEQFNNEVNESSKQKFVEEISVNDPESKGEVELEVYKDSGGGMFAIDSSYLEQNGGPVFSPFTGKQIKIKQ